MELTINACTEDLYLKYAGQHQEQSAYLALDIEDGTLFAGVSAEIGGAVPARVWHGRELQFAIPGTLKPEAVNCLMRELADDMQAILDGAEVVWNGNNYVGKFTDDAQDIIARLICDLDGRDWDPDDQIQHADAANWVLSGPDTVADLVKRCMYEYITPDALVGDLVDDAACEGYILEDGDGFAAYLQEKIAEIEKGFEGLAADIDEMYLVEQDEYPTDLDDVVWTIRLCAVDALGLRDVPAAKVLEAIGGRVWHGYREDKAGGHWSFGDAISAALARAMGYSADPLPVFE